MSDSDEPTRRRFLLATVTATAATACSGGGGSTQCATSATPIATGVMASSLAVGDVQRVSMGGVILYVGRDAGGYYAMSALCTHEQCTLPRTLDSSSQLSCPCHTSIYSATGVVLQPGPGLSLSTQASLDMYNVTFTGTGSAATLTVDTCMTVTNRTQRFMPT